MAKLQGAQIKERAKELKPARLLAFKLCQENSQITATELNQALKDNGFDIGNPTIAAWLMRFRKKSPVIHQPHNGRKLTAARQFGFKLWEENPLITGIKLVQAVKEEGFEVNKSTVYYWLKSFKKGKDITSKEKPVTAVETVEPVEQGALTLEQIIKAAGSVETLSVLFYQGVMRELSRKDAVIHLLKQEDIKKNDKISSLKRLLDEVTRDRNQVMREYNEKLAKVKVGTLTLDETKKRLVRKF